MSFFCYCKPPGIHLIGFWTEMRRVAHYTSPGYEKAMKRLMARRKKLGLSSIYTQFDGQDIRPSN